MTDNEHSSGGKLSVKSDFECLEEEKIHLEGIIAGYYCIENLYLSANFRKMLKFASRWRRNGTPPTIFRCAPGEGLSIWRFTSKLFRYSAGRLCRPNQLF